MFGLENQKKKKKEEFVFELEKELKSRSMHTEYLNRIQDRIQTLKKLIQQGMKQEDFDRIGSILYGYTSILKVMSRYNPK